MANLSSKTGTITTPVQTQISLANNATTSVQDMSAYDAQEVMGFVYVDATADLRAYFTVTVVKNGAGTYEIAGADVAGDQSGTGASAIAPVSFSMSGSILQATLPNITGFASAYLRYQLSAPYLGGNYPLSVDASQLVSGTVGAARLPAAASGTSGLVSSESTGTASVWLKTIGGADITGPVTIRWTRVGKIVTVLIPAISASTANTQLTLSTTQTSGVNTWPTEITPARQHYCIYSAISSTTYSAAIIGINSSGVCQLYSDMAGSSFTGSTVTKGVGVATTITYMLD